MIGEDRFERLVGVAPLAVFDDFADVEVLHRMLVGGESKLAAHRLEISLAYRGTQLVKFVHVSTYALEGTADQTRRLVALAGIEGRGAAVSRAESRDELFVGWIVEVVGPLGAVFNPQGRGADRPSRRSSKEKAGPNTGMVLFRPAWAYCLMKLIPMPPGRKKNTASGLAARSVAISAA